MVSGRHKAQDLLSARDTQKKATSVLDKNFFFKGNLFL